MTSTTTSTASASTVTNPVGPTPPAAGRRCAPAPAPVPATDTHLRTPTSVGTAGMRAALERASYQLQLLLCRTALTPTPTDVDGNHPHDTTPTTPPRPRRYPATEAALMAVGDLALRTAVTRHERGRRQGDEDTAWLLLLLTYLPVRDHAWLRATTPTPGHLRLWGDLTGRAPATLLPAPASLLACTAWRDGQAARATTAVTAALQANPTYRMANLIEDALRAEAPPALLEDVLTTGGCTPTRPAHASTRPRRRRVTRR
ncbi:MAG: DUF4192 family protein [Actinobacteria bacterium]|nr:DUF4192 family protein [Actinomycetota bacterium]MBI3687408.1 DUF4192 family protein [Actinomycetota bacterium]